MNIGNHTGVLIVDTTPLVGNFFEGFLLQSNDSNFPMKYCPLFADSEHQEWFEMYFQQELIKRFQQGELKIPGLTRLAGSYGFQ